MPQYLVTWVIDVEADDPTDAAADAWRTQKKVDSQALVFDVVDKATGKKTRIDLLDLIDY